MFSTFTFGCKVYKFLTDGKLIKVKLVRTCCKNPKVFMKFKRDMHYCSSNR